MNKDEREALEQKVHRSGLFQRVFAGAEGKEALDILDNWAGFRNDTFDPDPQKSAYNAGRRAVVIFIHNVLDGDVEQAMKVLGESK